MNKNTIDIKNLKKSNVSIDQSVNAKVIYYIVRGGGKSSFLWGVIIFMLIFLIYKNRLFLIGYLDDFINQTVISSRPELKNKSIKCPDVFDKHTPIECHYGEKK